MKLILTIAALLLLAACQLEEEPVLTPGAFGPDLAARAEAQCIDRGGRWGKGGLSGTFVCYEDTRDANQTCDSAQDCEGICFARSRTCSPVKPIFGCHDILNALGAEATLCIE